MKIVTLVPGAKPNTVNLPMPDPVLQYLGWKEGDEVRLEIHRHAGKEVLMLTRDGGDF